MSQWKLLSTSRILGLNKKWSSFTPCFPWYLWGSGSWKHDWVLGFAIHGAQELCWVWNGLDSPGNKEEWIHWEIVCFGHLKCCAGQAQGKCQRQPGYGRQGTWDTWNKMWYEHGAENWGCCWRKKNGVTGAGRREGRRNMSRWSIPCGLDAFDLLNKYCFALWDFTFHSGFIFSTLLKSCELQVCIFS